MKIVYGGAGSGKSYYCMHEIQKNIEEQSQRTLIYIVPEQYSLGAEMALTQLLQRNGTIQIQVLSFKRLAYRVFNELGYTKTAFSKASKSMFIYYLLLEQEKNLKVLKGASKNRGLVDTVCDFISELKRYQITWEMLQDVSVENEYLRMKLQDIALIYRLFEEKIGQESIDIDSRLTALSQLIPQSPMLKGAKIWIDEFDSFTPQEFAIIEALHQVADITVAITLEKETQERALREELFTVSRKTFEKLKQMGEVEEVYLSQPQRFENKELSHLANHIFRFPYPTYPHAVENIHLSMEENPDTEMESVAKMICQKVREEGLRYENIAILTRDLSRYQKSIRTIFPRYEIPYFFDDKKEVVAQPLLTLVTALLDIISQNYPYDAMFHYLKTGLTNLQDIDDIDLIENYVLQYGIRGQKWLNEWEYPHENLEKINFIREQIVMPIVTFKENLQGKKTAREITTELYQFLIQTNVFENIQNKVKPIEEGEDVSSSELAIASTSVQVWNILMEFMDELVACLGEETMSFEKYRHILMQGIATHQIGILPTAHDQVMIGDISRTRNANVKILWIVGVNDGVFPMPFSSEGLINDRERDLLLEKGMELAKNTKLLLLEENFNIYKSLTTPSRELYLSYPIANQEGSALRPSTMIAQMKNLFPSLAVTSHVLCREEGFYTKEEVFSPLLQKLREYYDGKEIDSKWQNAYLWYRQNEPEKMEKVQSGFDYHNTIEYLDRAHTQKIYGKEVYGSVSRLETYANCPFSFYLRYGLKLQDRKVFRLDTPDIGLFLHDILDAFAKHFQEQNRSLREVSREEADAIVSQLVDESLANFKNQIFNSSNQMKVLSAKLKRVVKRMVWMIIQHIQKGEFEVEGTEIAFGKDKQFAAVEIELSEGKKLVLSGVIDRMDIAKTEEGKYVRIIDYKSYSKELKLSDIYYGLQLQLLVYMDAAMENTKGDATTEDELLPGGMLYLKLDDPMITKKKDVSVEEMEEEITKKLRMKGVILSDARLLKAMDSQMVSESSVLDLSIKKDGSYTANVSAASKEQWGDLLQHMKKILKQLGEEMLSGNIKNEPIKKKKQTPCEYCRYSFICRFDKELGNQYRVIHDLKTEEVFRKIQGET